MAAAAAAAAAAPAPPPLRPPLPLPVEAAGSPACDSAAGGAFGFAPAARAGLRPQRRAPPHGAAAGGAAVERRATLTREARAL